MRRELVALLFLTACWHESGTRVATKAPAPSASTPPAVASTAPAGTTPPAAPEPEAPLAWGTRPPKEGPLFPVVDGTCVSPHVQVVGDTVLYSSGDYRGDFTKGGRASFGRFTDDDIVREPDLTAPATKADAKALDDVDAPVVTGTWPQPILLVSNDRGGGRSRIFDSIWTHDTAGWKLRASSLTDDGTWHVATLYRGHVVATRTKLDDMFGAHDPEPTSGIVTWKLRADAPEIPGITALTRSHLQIASLFPSSDEGAIYALGDDHGKKVLRWVRDGRAGEITFTGAPEIGVAGSTASALFLVLDSKTLARIEGGKQTAVALELAAGSTIQSAEVARDGAVWVLGSDHVITIVRGDRIEKAPLPKPTQPMPKEERRIAFAKKRLAGIDGDAPYAIGEGGALFQRKDGAWTSVPLPTPPFATSGRYQVEALTLAGADNLFVQASYLEKGIGWPGALRYRAILRTKRPKEVLRCNERIEVSPSETGADFMSFPPIATESCPTPFVILLRTAYNLRGPRPAYAFDRKTDYPTVRAAIKATPSLGESVDLVEVVSGEQRYLGARVPSVAAGKELALAVVKRVETMVVHTPEVVCGIPKEERVIHVDVATGKTK